MVSGKYQRKNRGWLEVGAKDGDDYYWYIDRDDNIIMYTDSKDLNNGKNGNENDLEGLWDQTASANIGGLLD